MPSNEFSLEIQKIIKDEYKKAVSLEDATKIAQHIAVLFDLLARNTKSANKK